MELTFRQCDILPEKDRRDGDTGTAMNEVLGMPHDSVVWTIDRESAQDDDRWSITALPDTDDTAFIIQQQKTYWSLRGI